MICWRLLKFINPNRKKNFQEKKPHNCVIFRQEENSNLFFQFKEMDRIMDFSSTFFRVISVQPTLFIFTRAIQFLCRSFHGIHNLKRNSPTNRDVPGKNWSCPRHSSRTAYAPRPVRRRTDYTPHCQSHWNAPPAASWTPGPPPFGPIPWSDTACLPAASAATKWTNPERPALPRTSPAPFVCPVYSAPAADRWAESSRTRKSASPPSTGQCRFCSPLFCRRAWGSRVAVVWGSLWRGAFVRRGFGSWDARCPCGPSSSTGKCPPCSGPRWSASSRWWGIRCRRIRRSGTAPRATECLKIIEREDFVYEFLSIVLQKSPLSLEVFSYSNFSILKYEILFKIQNFHSTLIWRVLYFNFNLN